MSFTSKPDRDAFATIAGFVYQVDVTILAWLNLQDKEVLELERGEDLDLIQQKLGSEDVESRMLEQVKRRSGTLTLRTPDALEALANFCEHRSSNPLIRLSFRFVTTMQAGTEQGWSRDRNGIATWEAVRRGEFVEVERTAAIDSIRSVLQTATQPGKVKESDWKRLQDMISFGEAFPDFITNFEWGIASEDYIGVEQRIKSGLIQSRYAKDSETADLLFDRLFVAVFKKLSLPGLKRLTPEDLRDEIEQRRPSSDADRELVRIIRSELTTFERRLQGVEERVVDSEAQLGALSASIRSIAAAQDLFASIDLARFAVSLDIPDFVVPLITRSSVVHSVTSLLAQKSVVSIVGEPGCGKTQLSLLVAKQLAQPVTWLDIPRSHSVQQACVEVDAMIASITNSKRSAVLKSWYQDAARALGKTLVVLDNVPRAIQGDPLTRRIELLGSLLAEEGGKLLVISYYQLPRSVIDVGNIGEVVAPRLTDTEITELLVAHGAPLQVIRITPLVSTATQGLPTLVAAIARYLASQSWNLNLQQVESILRADFAQGVRTDSQTLIELTVPESESRELLYRLTLPIGGFTRNTVALIARVPHRIQLSNEKFEHLLGLWVQPFVGDKFIVSPLINPSVARYLAEGTCRGVHAALALSIISRRTLEPLDVIACVFHFNAARLFNQAALVLLQALLALTEGEGTIEDDWGISDIWTYTPLPDSVDINLRVFVRALQVVALDGRGRDIAPVLVDLDRLLDDAGDSAWGTAMASSLLTIRLFSKYPALANKYLLLALGSFEKATLPDGSTLPSGPPLVNLFWATALKAASDSDVESWISAVRQLNKNQVATLAESDMAQDNSGVLSDGVWFREYQKSEHQRNWDNVERLVERIEELGRDIGLRVLEASAIRTEIMITAEWRHDIPLALNMTKSALVRFDDEGSRFLVTEVMGRQLSYAGRSTEAIEWLQRARSFKIVGHVLWRRNVLITLAGEVGKDNPDLAAQYTKEALELARNALGNLLVIEALAENAIALWNAGRREQAFETLEEAVRNLLAAEGENKNWKNLFLGLFHTIVYFSSIAYLGKLPTVENFSPPTQGMFLGLGTIDTTKFNVAQKSFIRMRMAMLAEGLGNVRAAGSWSDEALLLAAEIPEARSIYPFASLSVAPALLQGEYSKAIGIALIQANAEVPSESALVGMGLVDVGQQQRVQAFFRGPAKGSIAMMHVAVPLAYRLATLKLQGTREADIDTAIREVSAALSGDAQTDGIVTALRASLMDGTDWAELKKRGDELIPRVDTTAAGLIYVIGSAIQCPLPQALYLQSWMLRDVEKLFSIFSSIRRELIYPFFKMFWMNAVLTAPHQFRTAEAYTRQSIESVDSHSINGIKHLLKSMSFCLGTKLPDAIDDWLSLDGE